MVCTKRYKKIMENYSNFEIGFRHFTNGTNRSGIIDKGRTWGINQNGNYKIDCRFNKGTIKK